MTDRAELRGKVALVTGAGSGIGRAAAIGLARAGAELGVLGRTEDELEQTARLVEGEQGRAHVLVADVSKPEQVEAAIARLVSAAGRLDVVFANAGVNGVWAPIEQISTEEWQKTLAINLSGTFFTLKYAAPHLKRQGGSIVVCASVNGTRMFSNTGASAYSTSKAGQVALSKMLAVELARDKVRVNVICPGAIESEIDDNTQRRNVEDVKVPVEYPEGSIPLTRGAPGRAEQVADLVVFLASDRSSHISGTEVWIDGAQSLIEG
jgi:NAD(P)-dependent dehydrogenase (short-subunit alcohol dehydrogenase family)